MTVSGCIWHLRGSQLLGSALPYSGLRSAQRRHLKRQPPSTMAGLSFERLLSTETPLDSLNRGALGWATPVCIDTMYRGKATANLGLRDSGAMPHTTATKGTSVKAGDVTAAQM